MPRSSHRGPRKPAPLGTFQAEVSCCGHGKCLENIIDKDTAAMAGHAQDDDRFMPRNLSTSFEAVADHAATDDFPDTLVHDASPRPEASQMELEKPSMPAPAKKDHGIRLHFAC